MLYQNDLSNALLNLYDVRRALSAWNKGQHIDDDGTEATIGDCLDDAILFLENLEE
jgi:hypothetical protein